MEVLAWPAVALILGLVVIFAFKQPLTGLLTRARRITKDGIEADSNPGLQNSAVTEAKKEGVTAVEQIQKLLDSQLIVERETLIRKEIDAFSLKDSIEREKFMIRTITLAHIQLEFREMYSLIWGSQLMALQTLNNASSAGVDIDVLRFWYEHGKTHSEEYYTNYDLDRWVKFLVQRGLIESKDNHFYITLIGREFLKFLVAEGKSFAKPG